MFNSGRGYDDPTAWAGMRKANKVNPAQRFEQKHERVLREVRKLIKDEGFELMTHIMIKDRKTGQMYR